MDSGLSEAQEKEIIATYVAKRSSLASMVRSLSFGSDRPVLGILLEDLDGNLAAMLRNSCAAETIFLTSEGLAIDVWCLHRFIETERIRLEIDRQGNYCVEITSAKPPEGDVKPTSKTPEVQLTSPPAKKSTKKRKPRGHLLIDPQAIEGAFKEMKLSGNEDPKKFPRAKLLNDLRDRPRRALLKASTRHLAVLDSLREDFPNFSGVLEWIEINLRLKIELSESLGWPPFLLHGDPGVGKTAFAKALAGRFSFDYAPISIAATSATWTLRGGHRTWRDGGMGMVANRVLCLDDRRGLVVVLDELDKMQDSGKNFPIEPTLLELLEPGQSDAFKDEFLDVPLNITPLVTWIGTANRLSRVSAPLQSRLQCFAVPLPTQSQMPAIVRSVDREYRGRTPGIARRFVPLDSSVINAFTAVPARDLFAALVQTYGHSLRRPPEGGKRRILVGDVHRGLASTRRPVPAEEPAEDFLAMAFVPLPRGGGGGAPPGAAVH